jgi:hypothetical protein
MVFSGKEHRPREGHQRQGLSEYRSGWAWKLELLAGDGYARFELGSLGHGERHPQEDRGMDAVDLWCRRCISRENGRVSEIFLPMPSLASSI